MLRVSNRVANLKVVKAHDGANVATGDRVSLCLANSLKGVELLDLLTMRLTVFVAEEHGVAVVYSATMHASHSDTSHVGAVV